MRLFIATALVTGAFTLGMSQPAHAATLFTPMIDVEGTVTCTVVNVSTKRRELKIEILDDVGDVVSATNEIGLDPNEGSLLDKSGAGLRYCKITVAGKANAVRGSLYILTQDGARGTVHAQ